MTKPKSPLTLCQDACQAIDPGGDVTEALGAVVDGVHGSNVGQQGLGSADVGRGLVTPDVLLTRLHGHAQRRPAHGVPAHTCSSSIRQFVGHACIAKAAHGAEKPQKCVCGTESWTGLDKPGMLPYI